jgi:hypothetical protein
MQLIENLYLGWSPLDHPADCPSPTWDVVEMRHDDGVRIVQTGAERHACANDGCFHTDTFGRVQVRLLCRDCGSVRTISGEGLSLACTDTSLTGWGQTPRQIGGVWLWPGQPAAPGCEPHDFLVTREHADAVTTESLYGIVTRYRDADGSPRWIAGALPDPSGKHQVHSLRWRYRTSGLTDLTEAAAWIAAADTRTQRPLVVSV